VAVLLEVEDVTVRFGGLTALTDVSAAVSSGEVVGVIGPNGAGKTTLFNVICGFVRASEGQLRWRGQPLRRHRPSQLASLGIARIAGLKDELPASSIVSIQRYDPTNTKIAPQAEALQKAGAQVVISFSVPAFTALLWLTDLSLKFAPQLVVSNVGSDPKTLSGLLTSYSKGAAPGKTLIQGIITDGYLATAADPSNSWIKLFEKIHNAYIPKLPFDGNVEYGMAAAYAFAQALQAAGQNPTRASIVAAVNNSHFLGPGLVPFGYSATSHSGYIGTQMGIIHGLSIKLIGQPLTTDDGSGPITAYSTPQVTAPANGIPPH
jgi:branched-chain amino acid transport system substrate-binding protein